METLTEKSAADTAAATGGNGKNGSAPVLVQDVALGEIVRSPFNRDVDTKSAEFQELVDSIRQHGVIQPGVARPLPAALDMSPQPTTGQRMKTVNRYELVIGEHRWLGSREAKRLTMPLIVRRMTDLEAIELQAIENDKRKDLSPIEEAEKYQQLIEQYEKAGAKKEAAIAQLCEKLSKGKSTVYEALRLLKLPAEAKAAVKSGKLPPSHAGLLLKLEDFPNDQKEVGAYILKPAKNDEIEDGVLSFRSTRVVVAARLKSAENRKKWGARVEADFKKGIKFLDEETCKKVMPHGNDYVDSYRSGFVEADDYCDDYDSEYGKLWGKFEPPKLLVHNADYSSIKYVYKKSEALASIKANGKKPPERDDGSRRAAAAKAAAAKTRKESGQRRAIISAVVKRAAGGNGRWTLELFKFIAAAMKQRVLSDTVREMFNRRGLKRDDYKDKSYHSPPSVWLNKEIAAIKNAPQAVGLIVDMAIAMDLSNWSGGQGSGGKLLDQACQIFGVDKKAVVVEEIPQKAAKGKVQTPGTAAAKAPAVKKVRKKSRGLAPATRKKLSAAMKERWANRQKGKKR